MCPSLKPEKKATEIAKPEWEKEDKTLETKDTKDSTPTDIIHLGRAVLSNLKSEKQWAAIISVLRQSLDVFHSKSVSNAFFEGCDFTAQSLGSKAQTVYLRVREIDKERLAPLMSLVFASLSRSLLSQLPNGDDFQVTFILDEFVRLGRLDSIVDMPAIGRGYNFNAMFIAQDYGQITDLYGREKLSAIESNTAYKIVLTQNNAEPRRFQNKSGILHVSVIQRVKVAIQKILITRVEAEAILMNLLRL